MFNPFELSEQLENELFNYLNSNFNSVYTNFFSIHYRWVICFSFIQLMFTPIHYHTINLDFFVFSLFSMILNLTWLILQPFIFLQAYAGLYSNFHTSRIENVFFVLIETLSLAIIITLELAAFIASLITRPLASIFCLFAYTINYLINPPTAQSQTSSHPRFFLNPYSETKISVNELDIIIQSAP